MDFELTEEQKMVQHGSRFCDQEIKPKAQELDQTERHPAEIVQKMAELSSWDPIPDTYGGGERISSLTWWLWRRFPGLRQRGGHHVGEQFAGLRPHQHLRKRRNRNRST